MPASACSTCFRKKHNRSFINLQPCVTARGEAQGRPGAWVFQVYKDLLGLVQGPPDADEKYSCCKTLGFRHGITPEVIRIMLYLSGCDFCEFVCFASNPAQVVMSSFLVLVTLLWLKYP